MKGTDGKIEQVPSAWLYVHLTSDEMKLVEETRQLLGSYVATGITSHGNEVLVTQRMVIVRALRDLHDELVKHLTES